LLTVRQPRDRRVAGVGNLVGQVLPRRDLADVERAFFAPAFAAAPGDFRAVPRRKPPVEGRRAVRRKRRSIEENPIFSRLAVADVKRRLVRVALALRMKITTEPRTNRTHGRTGDVADAQKRSKILGELMPTCQRIEEGSRVLILLLGPRLDVRGVAV